LRWTSNIDFNDGRANIAERRQSSPDDGVRMEGRRQVIQTIFPVRWGAVNTDAGKGRRAKTGIFCSQMTLRKNDRSRYHRIASAQLASLRLDAIESAHSNVHRLKLRNGPK
jgi:hypothetical protein